MFQLPLDLTFNFSICRQATTKFSKQMFNEEAFVTKKIDSLAAMFSMYPG